MQTGSAAPSTDLIMRVQAPSKPWDGLTLVDCDDIKNFENHISLCPRLILCPDARCSLQGSALGVRLNFNALKSNGRKPLRRIIAFQHSRERTNAHPFQKHNIQRTTQHARVRTHT